MADVRLTAQQQSAVDYRGGQLLVSAAAGSGKTKVLVERLFSHLEQGANVDDFLIITYTKAAASELRGKIASQLAKKIAEQPDHIHLRRQLFRVYQADIKTVDAFCVGILRQNVHLLQPVRERTLTPDFRVLDEKESVLLQQRVLERTLDAFYEDMDESDTFLAETLGAGRDDRELCIMVSELYEKLQSHPYPGQWLETVRAGWENIPDDLSETAYGHIVVNDACNKAEFWADQLMKATELCAFDEKLQNGYADRLVEVAGQLRQYRAAAGQGWDAMAAVNPTFRRMGNAPDSPEKQRIQSIVKRCKEAIKSFTEPFSVPRAQHLEDLRVMAPAMVALLDLTARFAADYQAEKVRRNVMDFSDQEHYAIALLRQEGQPTELAAALCGKYREVMVDEYQDSNAVQDCIFQSVSQEGEKLFCVGDVKQSIYRFRLADPGLFLKKYLTFTDAGDGEPGEPHRVVLSQNFRSRRQVLEITNFVMAAVVSPEMGEMEYGQEEQLYPGAEYYLPRNDCDAEFHLVDVADTEDEQFDRQTVEAGFVAQRIADLLREGYPVQEGDHFRPCTPEDIVILMRSPRSRLKAFTQALERLGIPCASTEKSGFFDTVEIAVLFSLLQVVDNPRQDVPLISVLRSPLFGFTADDLANVRALCREGSFYDALLLDESGKTRAFLEQLDDLRRLSREESVDAFLWQVYVRLHVLSVFSAMPDGPERRSNLLALYEYARQSAAMGTRSVFDFVVQLRRLMENDEPPAVSTHSGGGGVQIMSIHKSKGLEFPIVILCDLNKRFDKRDQQRPVLVHQTLGLGTERIDPRRRIRYDTLSKTAISMQLFREEKAEEMRILYVAMTRAKEKLIMVDCMKKGRRRLQDLCAVTGYPVAPEVAASAAALGDWILLPLLCAPEAATLREYAEAEVDEIVPAPCGCTVRVWQNPKISEPAAPDREKEAAEADLDISSLEWSYAHTAAANTPTKITATQLKGREIDAEIAEGTASPGRQVAFARPAFLQESMGLTAAEKGTAVHLCMQYLDFTMPPVPDRVDAFVEDLLQRRLLTEPQAKAVDRKLLVQFLQSPLCRRISRAREVWREYRFSLLIDAGTVCGADVDGEQMLLQGVVDCCFEEDGKLVIVDFKTDHLTASQVPERAEKYRPQLEAYCHAMAQVMEKEVKEKILYFFSADSAISL